MAESVKNNSNGPNNRSDPDVIIIGAGINALAAAVLLGRAGMSVLVIEQNKFPGGALQTPELTIPGFRHEIGAMNLNALTQSSFFAENKQTLQDKGVEIISADYSSGTLLPDGNFLGITTDRDYNLRTLAALSQADSEAWKVWNSDFDKISPFLFQILSSQPVRHEVLAFNFGRAENIPDAVQRPLRGILIDSLRENLTARFQTEAVQAMIATWGLHFDYAPDIAGGCWYPFIETNIGQLSGMTLAKGGAGSVTLALAEIVADTGGEVLTDHKVNKILIEDNRALGVSLSSGEEIRASYAIIASVTPTALLKLTDNKLPAKESAMAENYRYGPGAMLIHLALSGLPDWKSEQARRSLYLHVGHSLDYLATAYQQAMAKQLGTSPFLCIGQPSVYDPSLAPQGNHVLRIFVRAVPEIIRNDIAGQIHDDTWTDDAKKLYTERILDILDEHAPGTRNKILGIAIQSPSDLEALNPNLVNGDNNAGSMQLTQFYGNRPLPGSLDHRLPINGLYMCGAATWPGGGANPKSGEFVAEEVLADHS